jgi:hypothetical protein
MAKGTCDSCCSYDGTNERNGVGDCRLHNCETHWQHRCSDYFPVSFRYPEESATPPTEVRESAKTQTSNFMFRFGHGSRKALEGAIRRQMQAASEEIVRQFERDYSELVGWRLGHTGAKTDSRWIHLLEQEEE